MEPTSVGLCFDLINATAALASNVGQIIAELENAGVEFGDVVDQLTVANASLLHLKYLFEVTPLPLSLVPEFTRQVQKYENSLEDIDTSLRQVIRNNTPSLRRYSQEQSLASGDLWRLSNKILSFNQNLSLSLSTYSCAVISLVHDGVSRMESGAGRVESSVGRVEPGVRGVESVAGRAELGVGSDVRRVDWDKISVGDGFWGESAAATPKYGDIQSTASTNDSVGMGGWKVGRPRPKLPPRPPLPPKLPPRTQDNEAWCEPVPSTNAGINRYSSDSKLHPVLATRGQAEDTRRASTPSLSTRASGFFRDSRPQSTEPLNPRKVQDENFMTFTGRYGSGVKSLDLSHAQRIQDEEWRIWEQKLRDASSTHEM